MYIKSNERRIQHIIVHEDKVCVCACKYEFVHLLLTCTYVVACTHTHTYTHIECVRERDRFTIFTFYKLRSCQIDWRRHVIHRINHCSLLLNDKLEDATLAR